MPCTVYLLDWYMYSTFRQSDCLIEVTTKNNSFGPQTRGLQPLNPFAPEPPVTACVDPGPFYPL